MSKNNISRVLLTGPPGIGKTTTIQGVCNLIKSKNIPIVGFFTKEVRDTNRKRIGFDVITLDGKIGPLARIKDGSNNSKPTVGNYSVFVNEFETIVIPLLSIQKNDVIFVIDEIGKMELFSRHFENAVKELFSKSNIKIIATIPVTKSRPIPLIEKLKSLPNTTIITVDRLNRNDLPSKILNTLNI